MITLHHNPRCSKSREAPDRPEASGAAPEVARHLDTPPEKAGELLK